MAAIKTNEQLTTIIADIFKAQGYDEVNAEFVEFRDFKIKWMRTYRWVSFEISDYLKGADEEVIADVFEAVADRIKGENTAYSERVIGYITSEDFVEEHQPTFIQRFRGAGPASDRIMDAYESLVDDGLVERDPHLRILSASTFKTSVGKSSVLMRTVVMNERADELDDETLRYAVYTQVAHVSVGFDPSAEQKERYNSLLDRFPGRSKAETAIVSAGMTC